MEMQGIGLTSDTEYTLVNVKQDMGEVSIKGVFDTKGKISQGGRDIDVEMKGTQKGNMFINLTDGINPGKQC